MVSLGNFLNTPLAFSQPPSQSEATDDALVTLYRLGSPPLGGACPREPTQSEACTLDSTRPAPRVSHFNCFDEFAAYKPPGPSNQESQLLFLRGYPSARWLKLLGSRYLVDPEFFSRVLDFRAPADRSNLFCVPSLPSSTWNLIQLPVSTVGLHDAVTHNAKQEDIDIWRVRAANKLAEHHHGLSKMRGIQVGTSIVRQLCLWDEVHFSLEQRISICMRKHGQSFICG